MAFSFNPHAGGPSSFPIGNHHQGHHGHSQQPPPPLHHHAEASGSGARGPGPEMPPQGTSFPFPRMRDDGNSSNSIGGGNFDIIDWYPHFQSCVRYFVDHGQYSPPVQAVAAFVNIQLPFQKAPGHVSSTSSRYSAASSSGMSSPTARAAGKMPMPAPSPIQPMGTATLNPYIRRLVVTGFDIPAVLHGFFGDDWVQGVGRLHEVERRNYLFAAKSASWLDVKSHYDMGENECIPFMRPLQNVTEKEITSAESNWSEWLAMQDWMVGPRSPEAGTFAPVHIKMEDS